MTKNVNYAKAAMPLLLMVVFFALTSDALALQINPQGNPFGTRGDQAIGTFGANVLTILNAVSFYGGVAAALLIAPCVILKRDWTSLAIGSIVGLGAWTAIGSIAYGLGNGQAFQIPGL